MVKVKPKTKMLELVCPNCERIFFRSANLARTVTQCPACRVRITFDKQGKCVPIKSTKYAREDPKYVKTRFAEMKQHKVPFRTRMQVLSREYGGRGGYTSEELRKIVTGKTSKAYYIFPFVKGAPPEVNRILERTYRKHREAGDTKVAAAIAAWTKVKQAGYVKQMKPTPVWTKRSYNMKQLKPMQVIDYGVGAAMGSLTERGVRNLWAATRRHPRFMGSAGAFGVGYLTHKHLKRRRKRKKGYQLGAHFTPDVPTPFDPKALLKEKLRKGKTIGKHVGKAAGRGAQALLLALAAKELLDILRKRSAYMPDIRPDIELGGYEIQVFDRVVDYASVMPSKTLGILKAKTGAALHKTKRGAERGLLAWLIGFISAELLARGITTPKRRHEVTFPEKHSLRGYARLHTKGGVDIPGGVSASERLPRWGFQPFKPSKTVAEPLPRFKRKRKLGRKIGPLAAIPLATLLAVRLSKRRQEGYSFASAAKRTLRGVKKVGSGLGKGMGVATNIAIPAMIISELWPRKRKLPRHPPVQSLTHPYGKGTIVQMYPMRSKAQRRWMHWKKPKMAKEWEEETPEGKELPEKVSKHLLGIPILTPIIVAKLLASKKKKKKQYALPTLLRSLRGKAWFPDVLRLGRSQQLRKGTVQWANKIAKSLRVKQSQATGEVAASIGRRANVWETLAGQMQEVASKVKLEKAGLVAAGVAAGAAGHEVGKKRERKRVHRVVG